VHDLTKSVLYPEIENLDPFAGTESPGVTPPQSDSLPDSIRRPVNGHAPMEPREIASLGARVCDRLIELHERGLAHGNITPETVFLIEGDVPLSGETQNSGPERTTGKQARFEHSPNTSDPSADVSALGITLYELWTGCKPFEFPSIPTSVLESKEWRPDGQRLNDVILRACDRNEARRFPNAKSFKTELDRVSQGAPPAPDRLRWVYGAMTAVVLCAAGWMNWSDTPTPSPELELPTISADFLNLGLVAWYTLDGNADDASGIGNDGKGFNISFVPDRFGELNSAVAFHDNESVIHVNDSPSLDLSTSMTISAWVMVASFEHPYYLVFKGKEIQENYLMSIETDRSFGLAARMTDGTRDFHSFDRPRHRLQRNFAWQHVVASYDAQLGLWESFVDGKLHQSARFSPRSPQVNDDALLIGNSEKRDRVLNGAIDDVRIYGRALNQAEIQALYQHERKAEDGARSVTSP
jgi:hypothetical protein